MTEKEAQKVLNELNTVRIEVLNDEAKRLFEAIMKIADNRDELQKTVEQKDKMIDLMAVHLLGVTMFDNNEPIIFLKEEKVKQYFERQAENDTKCT